MIYLLIKNAYFSKIVIIKTVDMKKNLLLISGILCSAVSLQGAAPEGNLYILGLNGDTTPSEANLLVLGERDEDDIDDGIWRRSLT